MFWKVRVLTLTWEISPIGIATAYAAKKLERIIGENFMANTEKGPFFRIRVLD
jgi:hypothetical protein